MKLDRRWSRKSTPEPAGGSGTRNGVRPRLDPTDPPSMAHSLRYSVGNRLDQLDPAEEPEENDEDALRGDSDGRR